MVEKSSYADMSDARSELHRTFDGIGRVSDIKRELLIPLHARAVELCRVAVDAHKAVEVAQSRLYEAIRARDSYLSAVRVALDLRIPPEKHPAPKAVPDGA